MSTSKKLLGYLSEIESFVNSFEIEKQAVSKASVGWHIDHSLKVINNVIRALQTSDPKTYTNNLSFIGKVFLTLGYFPRGKAKAPTYVRPPEIILKEDLVTQIETAKTNLETLASLPVNAYFKHPFFGDINSKRVARFLETHTKHHLKIMREVLK